MICERYQMASLRSVSQKGSWSPSPFVSCWTCGRWPLPAEWARRAAVRRICNRSSDYFFRKVAQSGTEKRKIISARKGEAGPCSSPRAVSPDLLPSEKSEICCHSRREISAGVGENSDGERTMTGDLRIATYIQEAVLSTPPWLPTDRAPSEGPESLKSPAVRWSFRRTGHARERGKKLWDRQWPQALKLVPTSRGWRRYLNTMDYSGSEGGGAAAGGGWWRKNAGELSTGAAAEWTTVPRGLSGFCSVGYIWYGKKYSIVPNFLSFFIFTFIYIFIAFKFTCF